jgi:DNA repair protein RecO (recombination protein O)
MPKRAIIRTEAIVLRAFDYGETSQIVTLFTRERGVVPMMAKGARHIKSRFGSSLQPAAYTQVVFYYKPGRDLQTLSESTHVEVFHRVHRSLERITLALRVVELVRALLEAGDPQPGIFALTLEALRALDAAQARAANVWPFFQLRLASALGVAPDVVRAAVERVTPEGGVMVPATGAVYPLGKAPSAGQRASRAALRAYAVFARASLADALRMRLDADTRREAEALTAAFMRYQFERAYPSASHEVIGRLLEGQKKR